jgi:hypothetical protein
VGLKLLGVGFWGVVLGKMGDFSGFSSFWAKSAAFDRVSRAVEAVGGIVESENVPDDVGEEKTAKFAEILPVVASVVLISKFFPFLESTGDRDVAAQVGEPFPSIWDVLASVWVPIVLRKTGEGAGTEVDSDDDGWVMLQPVWVLMGFVWVELSVVECRMMSGGDV